MSRQRSDEEEEEGGGTFRDLHARTSAKGGAKKGAGKLWAQGGGGGAAAAKEKPRRERPLQLVEVTELPPRSVEPAVLAEWLDVVDYLFPSLDLKERAIYTVIWRHSRGAGQKTCKLSLPEIHAQAGGLSLSGVRYAIGRLEASSIVKKKSDFGRNRDQRMVYEPQPPKRRQ